MPSNFVWINFGRAYVKKWKPFSHIKLDLPIDFEAIIFFLPLAKHLRQFFQDTILGYKIKIQILKFHKSNCLV